MLGSERIQSARIVSTLVLSLGLALLSGCIAMNGKNGTSNQPTSSGVTVTPATANVRAADIQQFGASVKNVMDQSVTWSVNGTAGGDATVGRISATGVYTAPAALPNPASVSIEATSVSDKALSGSSMVSLGNPVPTVTAVSPASVAVGNFSITVTGTKFVNGAKVMFGGRALTTKFVSATQLTATGTTTASQKGTSVQVTVSNPDPGAMTSAGLMVKVGANPIVVKLTPATAMLHTGESFQFQATVTGATNPGIVWKVNGAVGGVASVGLISATGLYTAPAKVPGNGTVDVSALSVEDTSAGALSHATVLS